MEGLRGLRPALQGSLAAASRWFHCMTIPAPINRLHYSFEPSANKHVDRHCPIRDIGTAADLAVLQRYLGSREYDAVIGATLQHYQSMLVRHGSSPGQQAPAWCYLGAGRGSLGELSSVAHSAMLLLALAAWEGHPDEKQRRQLMSELAAGLLHEQRSDGAFKIYFEPPGLRDSGWQLYGGEAAYALVVAHERLGDGRLLHGGSRALRAYQHKYRQGEVDADELVFFANWQCQAGAAVHRATQDAGERRRLAGYLHDLQQQIIEGRRFYRDMEQAPEQQATVEVACALEGLAHCLQASLADAAAAAPAIQQEEEQERKRLQLYAECATSACRFLLEAQVVPGPGVPADSVGGFGHSQRAGAGQRVDVTSHVCCAFVKLLEVLEAHPAGPEAAPEE